MKHKLEILVIGAGVIGVCSGYSYGNAELAGGIYYPQDAHAVKTTRGDLAE